MQLSNATGRRRPPAARRQNKLLTHCLLPSARVVSNSEQARSRGDKKKAMALAYVDSRTVMDRLDAVVGVANWQDSYQFSPDNKTVLCKLAIKIDGEWITKSDCGAASEQEDEGDRRKAAVSDALKRAAVHWGIGRYLSQLQVCWVEYDAERKCLKNVPTLPEPPANGNGVTAARR